jgi:alanyl-tRNA synthetase
MTGNEIRENFLQFFEGKGHRRVRSSSLVPHGDATLLFTNAGMNQFKDVFLGLEKRDYTRATTAQKCVRAGGKHNDLENVGFTKRHHTFFEMLGNFSFGDYFKKDAIAYAWELITSPQWFGIAKDKLYVTIFDDPDKAAASLELGFDVERDREAEKHWLDVGVPKDRIFGGGRNDNFWQMGDTGPCGPCSELHYDMGTSASELGHGTTAPECKFPCDCGRFVEIWNLVFMQYDRQQGGTRLLPKPCVDTGMGLERIAAVLQRVISNYDTDFFQPLIAELAHRTGTKYGQDLKKDVALRVIADHSRATTFLITDGVLPSNEGRGYVLRKILRRAIDFGRALGLEEPFLFVMSERVTHWMKGAYPELAGGIKNTMAVIKAEEERYQRSVVPALQRFDAHVMPRVQGAMSSGFGQGGMPQFEKAITITGRDLFFAYDTLGLRPDFMRDVLGHRDWKISPNADAEFEEELKKQREKARASWKGGAKEAANPAYAKLAEKFKTELDFYFGTSAKDCGIKAIITRNGAVNELKAGESGEIVLDRTAIYAESGGQVADTGAFYDNSESQLIAEVTGAFYPVAGLVAHKVVAKETLRVGDRVAVVADAERRARIIRNHTGTHLVNAALRNILGTHVKQSGSLNAPERLRFDFSHFAHVDAEELRDIEQEVNDEIRLNTEIETNVTSLEEALASGALAFFGDKYPEHNVRVVTIPDPRAARGFYSKELCGGTHVQRVGDIGVLKIVSEESVAAGVRRIEAVSGIGALEHFQKQADILRQVASKLNVGEDGILAQVEKLSQTAKQLEKELEAQRRKGALSQADELDALIRESREQVAREAMVKGNSQVQLVKGVKVAWSRVEGVNRQQLREILDKLRQEIRSGVVVLASVGNGDIALIAGITKDLTAKVHAGKLIQALAKQVGGSGGGRPDLAEAGGKDTAALKSALLSIPSLLEALL